MRKAESKITFDKASWVIRKKHYKNRCLYASAFLCVALRPFAPDLTAFWFVLEQHWQPSSPYLCVPLRAFARGLNPSSSCARPFWLIVKQHGHKTFVNLPVLTFAYLRVPLREALIRVPLREP